MEGKPGRIDCTRTQNEETSEVSVKRFKIKNWEQIEKGI